MKNYHLGIAVVCGVLGTFEARASYGLVDEAFEDVVTPLVGGPVEGVELGRSHTPRKLSPRLMETEDVRKEILEFVQGVLPNEVDPQDFLNAIVEKEGITPWSMP